MQSSFQSVHIVNKTQSSTKSEGLVIELRIAIFSLLFLISPCCAMVKLVNYGISSFCTVVVVFNNYIIVIVGFGNSYSRN